MNKQEFLAALKEKIKGLPQNDINRSLDFYSEMIDDCIENGMSESEAVASMGNVDEVASQILMDTSLPKLVKAKVSPDRGLKTWEIVLLVLGFPVWGPLLFAAFTVFLSVYIVIFSLVIAFFAVDLAFAGTFLGCTVGAIIIAVQGQGIQAIFLVGVAIFSLGAALLLFVASCKVSALMFKLCKMIILGIKSLFVRKEKNK